MITQGDAQDKKVAKRKSHNRGQWACAKESSKKKPSILQRVRAEEPKMHDRGQTDRHSTRRPEIKWACAKRLQEEALRIARGRSRRTDIT